MLKMKNIMRSSKIFKKIYYSFNSVTNFPQMTQQQRIDYWKCKISDEIITLIQNQNQIKEVSQISLRDQIINKIDQFTDADQESKANIKKLFYEGVQLDQRIFNQQRISDGFSKNNKITFCPTRFVTSRMFKHFKISKPQYQEKNLLLSGSFGFSKTFSCVLFHQLTNNIISYRLKYPKSVQILTESILNRPKVLYWSINLQSLFGQKEQNNEELNYIKRNSKQLIKIIQQNKQNYPNWTGSEGQIMRQYQNNNIKTLFIADQISQLTNFLKKKELISKQKRKKKDENNLNQLIDKKRVYQQQNIALAEIYVKIRFSYSYNEKNIYLSSTNINQNDWVQLNITGKQRHSVMKEKNQIYLEQINNPKNLLQLIDIYIFLFGQKINLDKTEFKDWHIKMDSQWLQLRNKLRLELLNEIYQEKGYFYLNIILLSQYLDEFVENHKISKENPLKLKQSDQKQDNYQILRQLLIEKLKRCIQNSFNSQKKKIFNFIQKKSNNKKIPNKILSKIYLQAQSFVLNPTSQPEAPVQFILSNFSQSQQKFLEKNIGINTQQQLFYFSENLKGKRIIKTYGTAGFIYKLLNQLKDQINPILEQSFQKQIKCYDASYFGNRFQTFFDRFASLENSEIIFLLKENIFETFRFYESNVLKFKPIPKGMTKLKEYSLIDQLKPHFQNLIQQSKQLENYTLFLQPRNDSKKCKLMAEINPEIQEQVDNYSKAIDVIFMKLSNQKRQNKQTIEIWIIDLGITQSKSEVQSKKKKFWNNFIHFKENTSKQYEYGKRNIIELNIKQQQQYETRENQTNPNFNIKNGYINKEFFIQINYYVVGHQFLQKQIKNIKKIKNIYEKDMQTYSFIKKIGSISIQQIIFSQRIRHLILNEQQIQTIHYINKLQNRMIQKIKKDKELQKFVK